MITCATYDTCQQHSIAYHITSIPYAPCITLHHSPQYIQPAAISYVFIEMQAEELWALKKSKNYGEKEIKQRMIYHDIWYCNLSLYMSHKQLCSILKYLYTSTSGHPTRQASQPTRGRAPPTSTSVFPLLLHSLNNRALLFLPLPSRHLWGDIIPYCKQWILE